MPKESLVAKSLKNRLGSFFDRTGERQMHIETAGLSAVLENLLNDDMYKASLKKIIEKVQINLENTYLNSSDPKAQEEARGGMKAIRRIQDEIAKTIKAGRASAIWLQKHTE